MSAICSLSRLPSAMSASLPAHITCPFPCLFPTRAYTLPTAMSHSQCLHISQYAQFSIHRKPIIVYVYPAQFSFFLVISLVCSCTHNLSFNLPSAMSILLSTHITCPFPCLFAPLPIPCPLPCRTANVFIFRNTLNAYNLFTVAPDCPELI